MLFRADDNAIDLRVEPAKKGFTIRGQILGTGFTDATVTLSDDIKTKETRTSETSEFQFDNVVGGRYELVIRGESLEVSLKAIDIE